MQNSIISFIGAGNMASSLIKGLLKEKYPSKNIWAANNNIEQLNKLKNLNINLTTDNRYAVQMANIVVLAVKPQILKTVLIEIEDLIQKKKSLIISLAVGINLENIALYLSNPSLAIIRCMPNTPALIGYGATGLFANQNCSSFQKNAAESIFRSVGTIVWLPKEEQIDVVAALSGSGPAYFFFFMEALEKAAVELGLSKENANLLTLQTALGSAQMAKESKKSMAELRQEVTSPGGTTEKALEFFKSSHFPNIVKEALKKAKNRAEEIAKDLK
ncbi:pyrroline-5-carboxylate reductase [Rickettsiella endosymbiont of Rhagonycha lignosa]|uniref:pyrroline-5-carboxylate reductase n=1 Tax=Rickettsiella endosymbiont of Rhagonycha lignosa TaxID=3077937 RepID=UPI00313E136A